jgi:hypothetical protein
MIFFIGLLTLLLGGFCFIQNLGLRIKIVNFRRSDFPAQTAILLSKWGENAHLSADGNFYRLGTNFASDLRG